MPLVEAKIILNKYPNWFKITAEENFKSLIEQLVTWSPTTKGKTDLVMALWFCEIRAREMLNYGQYATRHIRNLFLSQYEIGKQTVICGSR